MVQEIDLEEFIVNDRELAQYRSRLPEFTQLRAVSSKSLMWTFGVICFVWDVEQDKVLIIPYNLKKSHENKKKKMDVSENPRSLAIRAVLTEADLDVVAQPYIFTKIVEATNTDPEINSDVFYRYVAVITRYIGKLRKNIRVFGDKNGAPVWIKRKLLRQIFEEKVVVNNEVKIHPQLEAFNMFDEYAFAYYNLR